MRKCIVMLLCAVVASTCMLSIAADDSGVKRTRPKLNLRAMRLGSGVKTTPKWTWTTTVTTNDLEQITRITTGVSTNGLTKTICTMWNDNEVPLRFRETFMSMSDEDKGRALSLGDTELWTANATEGPVYPKEAPKLETDDNLTTEIREIQVRW